MKHNFVLLLLVFLATALLLVPYCYGTGFYNPDQSVSSQGQADAVVANPQDASTLYYNPAGIVRLPPWEITAGFQILRPELKYVSPAGQEEKADDIFFIPHLYFSANPPNSRFAAGVGVNSPYGLGTDWKEEGFARYIAPYSELQLLMINPNVAYRLTDNFSVAAGADFYTADITLDRYVPAAMLPGGGPPGMDIGTRIKGDGEAWGWNVAALLDICERVSFGASYRSKADIDFSGTVTTNPATPLAASCSFDFNLPSMAKAGFAFRPTDRFTFELDVDWLEWSRFKNVTVSFSPPVMPPEVSQRDWNDIFMYSVGAQYAFDNGWKIRGGYGYGESPIPDRTYDPGIPRNDLHVISVGVSKSFKKLSFDFACSFILSEERKVDSDVGEPFLSVDGTYDSFMVIIGSGLSYTF